MREYVKNFQKNQISNKTDLMDILQILVIKLLLIMNPKFDKSTEIVGEDNDLYQK